MSGFSEMMLCRGFSTIDSMSPLGHVQVQFKNTLLCQVLFKFPGNQGFLGFPKEGPFG